ncbi:hypothetical protein BABINDRAFT_163052 [Babjeviella inositovora NRRL Y-12698]|uniref:Uncharacterized protein n=1 Tax=Babjeviella inositovora NRRL Y-12698 TaxID=984486 RepID=A0A1E3QJY6_9ASCO|nr:uncharacterized protein BABINDRAFT_163052 [Babjeviella inositovora NRRL Y-12698]ODQ78005.1 hypothetical protein BABINDRAFT_163052 [Babjeviella inositovora NRRL Y-12698]
MALVTGLHLFAILGDSLLKLHDQETFCYQSSSATSFGVLARQLWESCGAVVPGTATIRYESQLENGSQGGFFLVC